MQTRHPSTARRLTTAAGVEAAVGRPAPIIMLKQIGALDEGCRTILAHSPIAALGYRDATGTSRTTYLGGTPGFARVVTPTRISLPAPGPAAPSGPASLFFLLPGIGELLRVNGTATVRRGRTTVDIQEAYVHCAQAVLRSRLWHPPHPATPPRAASADGGPQQAADLPGDGPLRGPGIAEFLAAAPFLALSTWDAAGGSDTSPRGDRQTVARIVDGRTLVIPDRRGNKRADTLHNLLADDRLSFAALAPGRSGVLHVRGRGTITDDPALLATMALRGTPPHAALLIDVEHAEVTAGDAIARSRMWTPDTHLTRGTVPDLMALASEHLAANTGGGRGGPPPFLLRGIAAIPGFARLMRLVMNRAYRSGLRKEGYDDPEPVDRTGPATRSHPAVAARPAGGLPGPAARSRAVSGGAGAALREVRIAEVRRETPSAVTLVLEDAADRRATFAFLPGQFFTLVADLDGRPVRRAYSASSAPGSPRLELTVKRVDGGRFSAHVHSALRPADRLALRGPSGTFHLPVSSAAPHDGNAGDLVLVAAGSGITPMMSMIRARLADRSGTGRIALLYSSRTEEETIFAAALARLERDCPGRLTVTHVLTSRDARLDADAVRRWVTGLTPNTAQPGNVERGAVERGAVERGDLARGDVERGDLGRGEIGRGDVEPGDVGCGEIGGGAPAGGVSPAGESFRRAHYYVCGPGPLLEAVQKALAALGVPASRVHHERYTSGADTGAAPTVPRRMNVEEDGQPLGTVIVEPGQTLLDAGLAAGLPMPYSCTVGNCGDCMVRLRSGDVAQNEPNCLTPGRQADGWALACVGYPLTEVTLDIAEP